MNKANLLGTLWIQLRTLGLVGLLVLSPTLSFANQVFVNPDDNVLSVYDDHFRIFGFDSPLCRQSGSECESYIQSSPATNSFNMATRNAWIAILLNGISTNKPVFVEYDLSTGIIIRINPINY